MRTGAGFTIVELLIVIVIIAILAAIVTVSYYGITDRAHASVLQSDLSSGASLLGLSQAEAGKYPAGASDPNAGSTTKARG